MLQGESPSFCVQQLMHGLEHSAHRAQWDAWGRFMQSEGNSASIPYMTSAPAS